jgi:hypothetical protein
VLAPLLGDLRGLLRGLGLGSRALLVARPDELGGRDELDEGLAVWANVSAQA